jgi:uncharacterized membrane protein YuzA (DUF378 family)
VRFLSLRTLAGWLVLIGGLNWLLVALGFNLVEAILGTGTMLTRLVYILVGLSAVYMLLDMLGMMGKKR